MTSTMPMLRTYPAETELDQGRLATAIDAMIACAQTCTACADACLGEEMVAELRACIRTNADCADVCEATARVLSRQTAPNPVVTAALLAACEAVCKACGDECASHAEMHEHCRICADACRACERACRDLRDALG
jgi:uncharacterized membrane protein